MRERIKERKMKTESFTAWAIDTQSGESHNLLGRYFFGEQPEPSHEGCLIALFDTRKTAREYKTKAFQDYTPEDWKPRVIKVHVLIEDAKNIEDGE